MILVYDQAADLVVERSGIQLVLTRASPGAPVVVLLDGSVVSGPVQAIDESGDYFEIATSAYTTQGNDHHA